MSKQDLKVMHYIKLFVDQNINNIDASKFIIFLDDYIEYLNTLDASKKTHYHKLDDWSKPVYHYISKMLDKYGFVNANPLANKDNLNVQFWLCVYETLGAIIHSNYLDTDVSNHHSSAFSRNKAFILELEDFKKLLLKQ